jgi:glyoxylase-like metal-dependent hydrolase (beta-lactamase superfamily II)
MAYGDTIEHGPRRPWAEFEYTEYLCRLEDLLHERDRAFAIAHGNPDDPRADAANRQWRELERKLEETAFEFVAHAARLRLEAE